PRESKGMSSFAEARCFFLPPSAIADITNFRVPLPLLRNDARGSPIIVRNRTSGPSVVLDLGLGRLVLETDGEDHQGAQGNDRRHTKRRRESFSHLLADPAGKEVAPQQTEPARETDHRLRAGPDVARRSTVHEDLPCHQETADEQPIQTERADDE